MPSAEFLQLVFVALIAGFVGYRLGRASVTAAPMHADATSTPLPGPDAAPAPRERPASAPPPASAGGGSASPPPKTPPRRSSAPPPAAAGLMDRGGDK